MQHIRNVQVVGSSPIISSSASVKNAAELCAKNSWSVGTSTIYPQGCCILYFVSAGKRDGIKSLVTPAHVRVRVAQ